MLRHLTVFWVILIFLGTLMSCRPKTVFVGRGASEIGVSDSVLSAGSVDTLNLGRVREGETVEKDIVLRNIGEKPFAITDIKHGCGCITSDFNRKPVAPGETKSVTIRFNSVGYMGEIIKKTYLQTSLSAMPYTIYVVANVE